MPKRVLFAATLALVVHHPSDTLAQESVTPAPVFLVARPPPPPTPAPSYTWYGYQTLLADLPAYVTFIVAITPAKGDAFSLPLLGTSAALYLAGGPIVHLAHDKGARAAGDVAIRSGLALTGALVGLFAVGCHDVWDDETLNERTSCSGVTTTIAGFALAGTLIDATVLALDKDEPPPPPPAMAPEDFELSLSPIRLENGAGIQAFGRF